ncbi:hypothetical protein FH972_014548 [Carpinus fangiana]|uniref:Protein TIC 20 n=1 Tax=Carpinus fangiana TaxID=176857 RepID=A0A5N6R9Z7_9ROSI|nr:hypothetical protein FH972_014548 [Carpinus fangiana]
MLPRQRKSLMPVQASADNPFSVRIPTIDEKPVWWWRILACLPYLLALQMSETAYYVQPFLERYEFLESLFYYIPGAVHRLPWWFQFAHFYVAYLGVVQSDKWPHYLRFHVAMGFLLESALLVVVQSSNLMPLIHFQGTFGLYYWAAVGFMYILMVLECVRCALAGRCSDGQPQDSNFFFFFFGYIPFLAQFYRETVSRSKLSGETNVVVIENEAEAGGFSEASEEASFECVVVGIVWNSNFALHFCPEQRESDRVEAGDAQGPLYITLCTLCNSNSKLQAFGSNLGWNTSSHDS